MTRRLESCASSTVRHGGARRLRLPLPTKSALPRPCATTTGQRFSKKQRGPTVRRGATRPAAQRRPRPPRIPAGSIRTGASFSRSWARGRADLRPCRERCAGRTSPIPASPETVTRSCPPPAIRSAKPRAPAVEHCISHRMRVRACGRLCVARSALRVSPGRRSRGKASPPPPGRYRDHHPEQCAVAVRRRARLRARADPVARAALTPRQIVPGHIIRVTDHPGGGGRLVRSDRK